MGQLGAGDGMFFSAALFEGAYGPFVISRTLSIAIDQEPQEFTGPSIFILACHCQTRFGAAVGCV